MNLKFFELISLTVVTFSILIGLLTLVAMIPLIGIGLKGNNIADHERKIPNLGIWRSIKNTFYLSVIGIIVYSSILIPIGWILSIAWGISSPINGFATALICGLSVGLYPALVCIQHLMLRLVLYFSSKPRPWGFVSFLKYSRKRMFLQRVGGGYKFIHSSLQDHFARIKIEEFIEWMEADK